MHGFPFHTQAAVFLPDILYYARNSQLPRNTHRPLPLRSSAYTRQYSILLLQEISAAAEWLLQSFLFPHPGSSESCLLLPNPNPGLPLCRSPTQALSPADPTIPILPALVFLSAETKPLSEAGKADSRNRQPSFCISQ